MSGDKQDLSRYFKVEYGVTVEGKRFVNFTLPWPSWTKSTRVAAAKTGGRFLSKAAKSYRSYVEQAVLVANLPERPWLREGYFWELLSYTVRSDHDQHAAGLVDDFVVAGLCVDDKFCNGALARRIRCATKEEERIVCHGREE